MLSFKSILLVVSIGLVAVAAAEKFEYNDYKLVQLQPKSVRHLNVINKWSEQDAEFDLWTELKRNMEPVTVLLSPKAFDKYQVEMKAANIKFDILHENAELMFQEQLRSMRRDNGDKSKIVGKFARFDEIQAYLKELTSANPDIASTYLAGSTFEKRDLTVLVLKSKPGQKKVWIDCGIHAREWISPATCIWMIDQIVKEHKAKDSKSLLNKFEFHILPVLNPDGYEYTWTTYRMWRKNRRVNSGSSCVGVDLNRNWGYKWLTGGSSTSPCSDTFAGPTADSENETKAVQKAIMAHKGEWASFITIHTFGLWWFTNWGYTTGLPSNYDDVYAKAKIGANAAELVHGNSFLVGSSARILYVASGGSEDWAYGVAGVPYSYCLELRPGKGDPDSGYGFALPEDRAPKAGEETFAGVKAFLNAI